MEKHEINMAEEVQSIKEERILDDTEEDIDEVEVFHAGEIKIEYPLDTYEHKSTTDFGSLITKVKDELLDHEPMQPHKFFEVNQRDILMLDRQEGCSRINMEVKHIKEESILDDIDEAAVFRAGAIKIEYPLDTYEYKSTTDFISLITKAKEEVVVHDPMQPDETEVDADEDESEASDDGSTSGDSSCEEEHSGQEKAIQSMNKKDQGNQVRCSTTMPRSEKPIQCAKCPKQFANRSNFNRHQMLHTGAKPFQCDKCPKQFAYSNNLKIHQRIHTGEKPFQCEKCLKQFARNNTLKIHQRLHTGEKPFQCDKCQKQFADCSGFIRHQRLHTGEKPFQCDQCLKQFSRSHSLKIHQRLHTGVMPFHCDKCPKLFPDRRGFIKIHPGDKPFQCDKCPKQLAQSSHLKKHQMKNTEEKPY